LPAATIQALLYSILLGLKAKPTLALPIGRDAVISNVFSVVCMHPLASFKYDK
jgi:hypothetical protein